MKSAPEFVERRLLPRRCCGVTTVLYVAGDICETTSHDICASGVGVMLDRAIEPDTRLTVELFNTLGHFWHRKRLRIIHATPCADNLWMLGSVFVQEFSAEELRALVGANGCAELKVSAI